MSKGKLEITVWRKHVVSPEQALVIASVEAENTLPGCVLKTATISATPNAGNSWDVEATFEKEIQ